jgi:hypothetical protein
VLLQRQTLAWQLSGSAPSVVPSASPSLASASGEGPSSSPSSGPVPSSGPARLRVLNQALPSAGPSGGPSSSPALAQLWTQQFPQCSHLVPDKHAQFRTSGSQVLDQALSSAGLVLAPRSSPSLSSQDGGPSTWMSSAPLPGPSAAQRQPSAVRPLRQLAGTECFPSAPRLAQVLGTFARLSQCWTQLISKRRPVAPSSGPSSGPDWSRGYSQVSLPAPVPAVPQQLSQLSPSLADLGGELPVKSQLSPSEVCRALLPVLLQRRT